MSEHAGILPADPPAAIGPSAQAVPGPAPARPATFRGVPLRLLIAWQQGRCKHVATVQRERLQRGRISPEEADRNLTTELAIRDALERLAAL